MYKFLSGFFFISGVLLASLDAGNSVFPDAVLLVSIVLSAFCLLLSAYNEYKFSFSSVIVVALVLRFLIMLWNVYGRDIYCLPGVGTDTEGFYRWAKAISEDISLLKGYVYGGYYTKFLGLVFYLTRPSYLLGSYLNYLYGAISISLLYKTLCRLDSLDEKYLRFGTILFALEPFHMCLVSSMRRESMIILFIMASVYHVVKWADQVRVYDAMAALAFVLAASALHAGVIGTVFGYIILFVFYEPRLKKWVFTKRSIRFTVLFILGAFLVLMRYSSVFLSKILVEDKEDLLQHANRVRGNSAYLVGLQITSINTLILYTPLKLFYFLTVPLPWDWRNLSDIIAFCMDSLFYIYLAGEGAIAVFSAKDKPFAFSLSISCLSCLVLFAIGTHNSGTAMRHRLKMLGLMIVVMCMVRAYNNRKRRY